MRYFARHIAAAFLSLTAIAAPAAAQEFLIGPNGVEVIEPRDRGYDRRDRGPDRRDRRDRYELSDREAVRIARREGLREVDNVSRRRAVIRVDGIDRRGRDITVIIDRRSGDILNVR